MHTRHFARLALLMGYLLSPYAMAVESAAGTTAFFVESERYSWEEFQPKNTSILEETGPRAAVGVAWSNLRVPTGGPVYRAHVKVYGGVSDYKGQDYLSGGLPVTTDANYLGMQAEGLGGYRLGGRVGFELVSGVGMDIWQRNITDTTTGYNSLFAVLNAKIGAGLFMRFENFGLALRAGPKLPLVAWERVDLYDGVDLSPKPQLSWFGNAELSFGTTGKDNVTLAFYYDSYRFKASDTKPLNNAGTLFANVNQPETESNVIGARLAIGF